MKLEDSAEDMANSYADTIAKIEEKLKAEAEARVQEETRIQEEKNARIIKREFNVFYICLPLRKKIFTFLLFAASIQYSRFY